MTDIATKLAAPGFTEEQTAALEAPLARAVVKGRKQAGREVSYIEGWHAIAEANRIFGFDGWDRETVECRCVSEKPCVIGAGGQYEKPGFRVAYVGKVRVTVRAGERIIVREGTGYGSGIDADVGEAHESAAKECETDALKRSLMTFGNPFGLALYDKTQAEVEPVARQQPRTPTRPSPAAHQPERSATNGSGHVAAGDDPFTDKPPMTPVETAAFPTERERRAKHLTAEKQRIIAALGVSMSRKLRDQVLAENKDVMMEIKEFHEPSWAAIIRFSTDLNAAVAETA